MIDSTTPNARFYRRNNASEANATLPPNAPFLHTDPPLQSHEGPKKRTTLDLEEARGPGVASVSSRALTRTISSAAKDNRLESIVTSSDGNGKTLTQQESPAISETLTSRSPAPSSGAGVRRHDSLGRSTWEKNGSSQGLGLSGHGAPPRRMTIRSDGGARSFTDLFKPERRLQPPPSTLKSLKNILLASPFNLLLVCIPVSWVLYFVLDRGEAADAVSCQSHLGNNLTIFITAFLSIIPLAQLLSYGTEEIALRVGQTLGGLINATLGNAVELIVAIIALFHCELTIVQTSLIGSVLSNLLLVLGTCFLVGGLRYSEQEFKQTAAQLNSSLLAMAVIAVLIPAGFHATLGDGINDPQERSDLLKVSRGVSIILLIIYGGYLFFTLSSHRQLYEDDEDSGEEPTLSVPVAVGLLCVSTALVGVTSEWLVDSINGVTCTGALSQTWVGLILLPIVSNAAEHWSAVSGASKNKMDLAMGIAVGSSIQISIFVIPLLVVISWIGGKPLSLLFDPFISILLFLAVLIVNYAISDGRSNYMEGWLLMMVYLIIALVTWFVDPSKSAELFPDSFCA